jgi:uncharacterized hydantoinase/oxoprolinase family protein
MSVVVGWDVGGAHLKAARAENGRIVEAIQVASPLRLGLERLAQSFVEAKAKIGTADPHAVTMTGELADTFSSRIDGVEQLSALAMRELAPARVSLYAGRSGFVEPQAARQHADDISSANWFASAALRVGPCSWTWARRRPTSCRSWTAQSRLADTPTPSGWRPVSWSIPAWCEVS